MNFSPLSAVCQLNMGQSPESSTYNKCREGIPFFQGNADFGDRHPLERLWCSKPKKIAYEGDILISVRAPIGALNVADQRCCIGRGLASLHPSEHLDRDYLYYFLFSKEEYLKSKGTGSTFKAISKKQLEDLLIPLPSILEQKKRSNILNKLWSNTIRRREQLRKLDELVKCRFVEMFGDMKMADKGWTHMFLGDVCDVRDGTHDSPKYHAQGYPLITSKNVTRGVIDFTGCNMISEEEYVKICQRSKVNKGDIIMPMIGTVGCPVIVDTDAQFAIKNVALIKFPYNSTLLNTFVKHLLLSSYFETEVIDKIRGGTQKFISLTDIRQLKVYIPPMELQNAFASFVQQLDKSKFSLHFVQRGLRAMQKLEILES